MRKTLTVAAVCLLASCAAIENRGAALAERRIQQNDIQRDATFLSVCDLSVGSIIREVDTGKALTPFFVCPGGDEFLQRLMERINNRLAQPPRLQSPEPFDRPLPQGFGV